MKSSIYLSAILVLGILVISPTSGYESLYGRTFNLFNLLSNPQTQFKSLLSRYSVLDASFNFLTYQYASLQSQITSLTSQISALTTVVNSLKPKCPTTAVGAKLIGSFCYTVNTVVETFANAQLKCNANGGILAEPLPANSVSFYSSITAAFPTETTTIGMNTVWLGLMQSVATGNPYTYLSNPALQVVNTNAIFTSQATPATTSLAVAVVLIPPGTSWKSVATPTGGAPTNAYICQYNKV